MNIVMLCRLYSPHIGGVEKHVQKVAEECVKDGHAVKIFTVKHDESLKNFEIANGIKIHRLLIPLLPGLRPGALSKFLERIALWGQLLLHITDFLLADIVHIHDVFFWYWPLRLLLPWKKVYITFHGFEAGYQTPTKQAIRARRQAANWTHGNMAVGAWIEKWYGTKPNVITYGAAACIHPGKYLPEYSKQKHLIDCAFLGRLDHDTGIQIYAETVAAFKNFQLDVFGSGELKPWIRSLQKKTRNIRVCGATEDSCTIFPKYDIACVSSYLSIIEAMQSRVLVVAYAVGELKYDYLTAHPRAKEMVIVRSPDELRSFLMQYKKEHYKDRVENAYKWAREQTWDRVYKKYLRLWGN